MRQFLFLQEVHGQLAQRIQGEEADIRVVVTADLLVSALRMMTTIQACQPKSMTDLVEMLSQDHPYPTPLQPDTVHVVV